MNIRLEEAKIKADELQESVRLKTEERDSAKAEVAAAKEELAHLDVVVREAGDFERELTQRLRLTTDTLESQQAQAQQALQAFEDARADSEREAERLEVAAKELAACERTRDEAERALSEAQEMLIEAGELERSSRGQFDARVQRAMDAQRALDQVTVEVQDAQETYDKAEVALNSAREAQADIPPDDEVLLRREAEKRQDLADAIDAAKRATNELWVESQRLDRAESEARDAKLAYETAQDRLAKAIEQADKADESRYATDGTASLEGISAYVAAYDLRSRAMQTNALALTRMADADIQVIRIRISRDSVARTLDEANARKARAEREIKEAQVALENAQALRESSVAEIAYLTDALEKARIEQLRLESKARQATADNIEAQRGLREVQDYAIRSGQANRNAANVLEQRTHTLSVAVDAVEVARREQDDAKKAQRSSQRRLKEAKDLMESLRSTIDEARAFVDDASYRIAEKKAEATEAERKRIEVTARLEAAEEKLFAAQRDLDIAQADLTDAQVAVIMAEIGN